MVSFALKSLVVSAVVDFLLYGPFAMVAIITLGLHYAQSAKDLKSRALVVVTSFMLVLLTISIALELVALFRQLANPLNPITLRSPVLQAVLVLEGIALITSYGVIIWRTMLDLPASSKPKTLTSIWVFLVIETLPTNFGSGIINLFLWLTFAILCARHKLEVALLLLRAMTTFSAFCSVVMIFLMTRQSSGFNTGLKRSKRQFSKLAVGSAVSVGASAQTTEASPMPLEVFTETNTSISAPRRSREDSVASSAFSPAFSFFSGSRLPPPSLPQIQEERSRNRDISTSALVTTPFGTTPFENSVHTTPAMPLTSSFYTSHPPASTVSSPSINSIQPSLYRVALGTERPLPALPTVPSSPLPSQSPPEEPSSEDTPNADSSQDQDRYSNVSYPPSYRTRPSSSAVTAPESPTTPGSSASFPLSSIPPPPPLPAHLRSSLAPIPDSEAGEIAASSQNDGETDTWMDLSRAPTYRTTLDI